MQNKAAQGCAARKAGIRMKEIKLVPDVPFFNSVDIAVLDFPNGMDEVLAIVEAALKRYYAG